MLLRGLSWRFLAIALIAISLPDTFPVLRHID